MVVLGDSHTRAYGLNPNFMPIFLGPGKEINFIDWHNTDSLKNKCVKLEEHLNIQSVIFCMGEPDTRYAMGLGWHPWGSSRTRDSNNYMFLEKCVERHLTFVHEISENLGWSVYVQNIVLTQDPVQCEYIDFYNEKLSDELGENFIAFNDEIRGEHGVIDSNFSWDMIHANNQICQFVESHLNIEHCSSDLVSNNAMKKYFKRNLRFNGFEFIEKKNKMTFNRFLLSAVEKFSGFSNRG